MQDKEIKKIGDSILSDLKFRFPQISEKLYWVKSPDIAGMYIIKYNNCSLYFFNCTCNNNFFYYSVSVLINLGILKPLCKLKLKRKTNKWQH